MQAAYLIKDIDHISILAEIVFQITYMNQIKWLQGVTLYQAILGKDMYRQIVMNTSDLI